MRRLLLIAALLWPGALPALQNTCTLADTSGSCLWGTGDSWFATDCDTVTCDAGAFDNVDDAIIIAAGTTVTANGDPTAGTTADVGITVNGVLDLNSKIIASGEEGVIVANGGELLNTCKYRSHHQAVPALSATIGFDQTWYVPEQIPCPTAANAVGCNTTGDNNIMRLHYTDADYNEREGLTTGDQRMDEAVADLDATRDIIWFLDEVYDAYSSHDAGHAYKIAAIPFGVGACFTGDCIDVEMDQGTYDQAGFPLTRRELCEGTLTGAAALGDRLFDFADTASCDIAADYDYTGRYLRFNPGTGVSKPYRIAGSLFEAAADETLWLLDTRGVNQAYGAATPILVDRGWVRGDPFAILESAIVTSSTTTGVGCTAPVAVTCDELDSDVEFQAGSIADLCGVVFQEVGDVTLVQTTIDTWKHAWIRDASDGHLLHEAVFAHMRMEGLQDQTLGPYMQTTGNGRADTQTADPNGQATHTYVIWDDVRESRNVTMDMFVARYAQDDFVDKELAPTFDAVGWTFSRCRAGPASVLGTTSTEFFEMGGTNGEMLNAVVKDCECVRCGGDAGSNFLSQSADDTISLLRVMSIGDRGGLGVAGANTAGNTLIQDSTSIGMEGCGAGIIAGPGIYRNNLWRETGIRADDAGSTCGAADMIQNLDGQTVISNVFANGASDTSLRFGFLNDNTTFRDNLVLNHDNDGVGNFDLFLPNASSLNAEFQYNAIIYDKEFGGNVPRSALNMTFNFDAGSAVGHNLIMGTDGGWIFAEQDSISPGGDCMFDIVTNANECIDAECTGNGFFPPGVSPLEEIFFPRRDSMARLHDCGPRSIPGPRGHYLYHSWSGITREGYDALSSPIGVRGRQAGPRAIP